MPAPKDWPWVRTQIPPEARAAAQVISNTFEWNLPAVYMSCLIYALTVVGPAAMIEFIAKSLDTLEPAGPGDYPE